MLAGARLEARADGTGSFSCTTYTSMTHSGDVWHISFSFHSAKALPGGSDHLFSVDGRGPRMDDGGPQYPWNFDFTFDRKLWGYIALVDETSRC
ncbi:DUF6294 family protein [Burkholderia ubonensis]|uniref:DUF6294 family protein n=1 Tax=Burkholderia ubonensis TaxID=101571 RepID=UPI0039F200D2